MCKSARRAMKDSAAKRTSMNAQSLRAQEILNVLTKWMGMSAVVLMGTRALTVTKILTNVRPTRARTGQPAPTYPATTPARVPGGLKVTTVNRTLTSALLQVFAIMVTARTCLAHTSAIVYLDTLVPFVTRILMSACPCHVRTTEPVKIWSIILDAPVLLGLMVSKPIFIIKIFGSMFLTKKGWTIQRSLEILYFPRDKESFSLPIKKIILKHWVLSNFKF